MKRSVITILIIILFSGLLTAQPTTSLVWLNEFHYDGVTSYGQSDQNEFVEFAVHNSIADNPVEMAKLKLVLYSVGAIENGTPVLAKGKPYDSTGLLYSTAETVHNFQTGGFTKCAVASTSFSLISKSLPILQDIPTAIAIVYNNTSIVQLLSYEKPFKMAASGSGGGAAAGNTSTVIMVAPGDTASESAVTPVNHSIGLMGTGIDYSNFSWRDDVSMIATPCAPNMDQSGAVQTFSIVLPAGITFTLKTNNRDVTLNWRSGAEDPGTQFYIEKAAGNSNNFILAATVNGRATSSGSSLDYKQLFTNMEPGVYTFRIRQVAANGKVQYSPALKAFIKTAYGYLLSSLYPNPASSKATFTLSLEKAEKIRIELHNGLGQTIKTIHNGNVNANNTHLFQVSTSELANGRYYVVIIGETFKETRPLIVSH